MPNYTNNLNLEKPLQSENYNIDIFNSNADKIDTAIQEIKGKVDGLDLKAEKVTLADRSNLFNATNAVILSKPIFTFERFLNPSINTACIFITTFPSFCSIFISYHLIS